MGDGARADAVQWEDMGGDGGECSRSSEVDGTSGGA